ncbi:MAG: SAP domain-containing protein [Candidatus Thalassarchaeaceae archaeon]|nr:SAP domain-containing protein [Candidatus Thalassarchaeaceae archaeon]
MTVAELKFLLKAEGLRVSGNKAELIERLESHSRESNPEPSSDDKYEITCESCHTILRVPHAYSGGVTCPKCFTKTQVTSQVNASNLSGMASDDHSNDFQQASEDYDFVVGPDGQMVAVKKTSGQFLWTHYFAGLIIPIVIFFSSIPLAEAEEAVCWLGPSSGVGLAVFGLATGRPGLASGAFTGIVILPTIFVIGCFLLVCGPMMVA